MIIEEKEMTKVFDGKEGTKKKLNSVTTTWSISLSSWISESDLWVVNFGITKEDVSKV